MERALAYRTTPRIEARQRATRDRLLRVGRDLVAAGGFRALTVARVSAGAEVATGTVYRYFEDKSALAVEVFSQASQREVDIMVATLAGSPVVAHLSDAIVTWCRRAQRGRPLAAALLTESVEPAVAAARTRFRSAYAAAIAEAVARAVTAGEIPDQDVRLAAAGIVGAMGEAVLGPHGDPDPEAIARFCIRALHPLESP